MEIKDIILAECTKGITGSQLLNEKLALEKAYDQLDNFYRWAMQNGWEISCREEGFVWKRYLHNLGGTSYVKILNHQEIYQLFKETI